MRQIVGVLVVFDESAGLVLRIGKNGLQVFAQRWRQAFFFHLRKHFFNVVAWGNSPEQQAALVVKNHVAGSVAKGSGDKVFLHDAVFKFAQKNGHDLAIPAEGNGNGKLASLAVENSGKARCATERMVEQLFFSGARKVKCIALFRAIPLAIQTNEGEFFKASRMQQRRIIKDAFFELLAVLLRHKTGNVLQLTELTVYIAVKIISNPAAYFGQACGDVLRQMPGRFRGVFAHDYKQCDEEHRYADDGCECA